MTLRALEGEPLADPKLRDLVAATARSLAERHGLEVLDLKTTPRTITVTLNVERIAAIGFAAELRRSTTRWYTQKYGVDTLWGEPPPEEGEEWKRGAIDD